MKDKLANSEEVQKEHMESYYKLQAKIYDATRWSFLFGRNAILQKIPFDKNAPLQILEVGCGTGVNLKKLLQIYSNATFVGFDISKDMLKQAQKRLAKYENRVTLYNKPYQKGDTQYTNRFDIILFSYCLTMVNPHWEELVEQAMNDLKPEGYIAVVDFHDTKSEFYKKFMRANHVRLDGHILPFLHKYFVPVQSRIRKGLLGIWEYMLFVGQKK